MKSNKQPVDKTYKLKSNYIPVATILQSKGTDTKPLLYWDEERGENRALRYAKNQKSPFVDEQDGHVSREPIIFEDGFLRVPKSNPVLQQFLEIHPLYNKFFVEVNKEKTAQEEIEKMDIEDGAIEAAKNMTADQLETVARGLMGLNTDKMTSAEIKRDVRKYARRNPAEFLDAIDDPDLDLNAKIVKFFNEGLLNERNNGRDIHFNLKDNKKRMLQVPFEKERDYVIASYFKTDEGIKILKLLEDLLE